MTTGLVWEHADHQYLAAGVAWIEALLRSHLPRARVEADSSGAALALVGAESLHVALEREAAEASRRMQSLAAEMQQAGLPLPSLLALGRLFRLTDFERHLILFCAAAELNSHVAPLCAELHENVNCAFPTFALALRVFDHPEWEALTPGRPLRGEGLLEIYQPGSTPLLMAALGLDERLLHYLKGVRRLNERLQPFVESAYRSLEEPPPLPLSQSALATEAARSLVAQRDRSIPRMVRVTGMDREVMWQVACHITHAYCKRIGQEDQKPVSQVLYRVALERLPLAPGELEELARLWRREERLFNIVLYLDAGEDALTESEAATRYSCALRLLERAGCLAFLTVPGASLPPHRFGIDIVVERPTPREQFQQWLDIVGPGGRDIAGQLAAQFSLSLPAIQEVARQVDASGATRETAVAHLWNECRKATRPRVDSLAQRIEVKATWDDLVLPAGPMQQLRHLSAQVRWRWRVYEDWGARTWLNRGLGINTLFAGVSGTGKTMAAEVLASDLHLDLYRIDLSAVMDKYIGEAEKRLCRLFDAFEHCGAILFFDECDALFGKRTEVKDSHDRYANIETSYLLQRLETYRGVAILATNHRGAIDTAFLRRLRAVITFPMPDKQQRRDIWERHLPPKPRANRLPASGLDYAWLARLELSGGNIQTVALNAAFLAAESQRDAVTMPDVISALGEELRKLGRPVRLPPSPAPWEMEAAS